MIVKEYYVRCDSCFETATYAAGRNAKQAREEIKVHNWRRINGKDICKICYDRLEANKKLKE